MVQLSHAYMTTGKTIDLTKRLTYTWSILQKFKFKCTSKVHSSKASILQHSAFSIVQLSHPYMTIGKNIALTRWTFVDKVMSLLFSMLSNVGHSFSSKEQASFNFMAAVTNAVILEPKMCLTLCNPMDWISVHGISQARILVWVAFPSPGDLPDPGIKPRSPALQADSYCLSYQGSSFSAWEQVILTSELHLQSVLLHFSLKLGASNPV